jgi:hypothetical protein
LCWRAPLILINLRRHFPRGMPGFWLSMTSLLSRV